MRADRVEPSVMTDTGRESVAYIAPGEEEAHTTSRWLMRGHGSGEGSGKRNG